VIPEKGEHVVFVVENGRATRRVVRIESILGNEALIASGVRAGETVVVEGQRALEEGLRVSVVEDGPAIPEPASESKPPATPAS
jgi:multidrug efflux pump subunit AcrA (membrane-fusion protein)